MATPINDFQDILDAMERNPTLRDALRRHILTDELLQMPVRLERVEEDISTLKEDVGTLKEDVSTLKEDVSTLKEDVSTLKEDVSTLKEDVGTLKEDVTKIGGNVSNLMGSDYESHVATYIPKVPAAGTQNQRHRVLHPEEQATSHRTARQSRKAG